MLLRTLIALLGFLALLPANAQRGPGGQRAAGRVYGRLLDENKKPVPFASIGILRGDSTVGGALVQENGDFDVPNLPLGGLKLRAVAMGYAPAEKSFTLTADQPAQDLGNLVIKADEVVLKAAEVTRERATQVLQVDRRVYNVEKDMSVIGGDATDVMKNIPGLSVDADGNVQMRGQNPRVFLDGRPTTLTLDQIPAADIERVEVITNPSVIFDASATGGIVNVVLKKSTRPGYSGQVEAGIGTNQRYNASGSLLMRQGRSAFSLGLGYSQAKPPGTSYSRRTTLADGLPTSYFNQNSTLVNSNQRANFRLGWDYNLNVRNTLSLSQSVFSGGRGSDEEQVFARLNAAHAPTGTGTQHNISDGNFTNYTSRAGFKRTTLKPGKEWSTDLTVNIGSNKSPASTAQTNQGSDAILPGNSFQERDSKGNTHQLTWQLDVADAYAPKRKLEWGFKADYQQQRSSMDVSFTNDTVPTPLRDTLLSNAYLIRTYVNAAYVNWSTALTTHWAMQAGLRVEQNAMVADRTDKQQMFSYNYPDGLDNLGRILFPAVYLSRKWDAPEGKLQRELQVNVSRKVNRPNHWQMMPFVMPVDAQSYRVGNPLLKPELSTLVEVNHLLPFGEKGNWLSSLYGRFTTDVITSYTLPMPGDPNVLLTSYANGSGNRGFGWENTVKLTLWPGLEATLNGNLQWVEIALVQQGLSYTNQGFNFSGKANLSQKLPEGLSLQVNSSYNGPRVVPQGYTLESWFLDVSVRKDIGKHFYVVASGDNLFNSSGWGSRYDTPGFTQETFRSWGSRAFRISATWRFGKADTPLFRRKQASQERTVPSTGGSDEGGE